MMHELFSSLEHVDKAILPVLVPWNITQTHITRHCEQCIKDADTKVTSVLSWALCSQHCLGGRRTVLETEKCWWDAYSEINRTQELTVVETRTPTSYSWRCLNDVLDGPGRNRTTDTRIFKTRVWESGYQVSNCINSLSGRTDLISVVPSKSLIYARDLLEQ